MNWPILVDSLNLAEISVVPLTYAIDEHGIVRYVNPQPDQLTEFINRTYDRPARVPAQPDRPPDLAELKAATAQGGASAWRAYGDALYLWGGQARLGEAMAAYQQALALDPRDSQSQFRLGVCYRRHYDSAERQPTDFQTAIDHWSQALELNPNQYIWRRRIQQYGPKLTKPYSFYDWVTEARREIAARGATPLPLLVEPGGAELAAPSKSFVTEATTQQEPDARGRIIRDERPFILVEATVVPAQIKPGETARVHLVFRPNQRIKAHWNNEVDPLRVWLKPPAGWTVDRQFLTLPNPPQDVSNENRELQFELRSPTETAAGRVSLPAYALYYVCEEVNGKCLYRRQDLGLVIKLQP